VSAAVPSLAGQVAIVTGGAGGIGSAVARSLLAWGARVGVVDLARGSADERMEWLECDVAEAAAVAALFETVAERFGRLDVLVHAAGITRDAVLWKMKPEDWSRVLRVNLDSAFHLLQGAIPLMRRTGGGSVVLVSSINGERGKFGQANYAASKAGLIGLGRTAARELGRFGIRVNVVAPGLIETPMTAQLPADARERAIAETALGRTGRPEDVAGAVLFLASSMAAHVTGQLLRVDGGQLMG
jgi:acetoacetyl-CoA reductase/3-oxoacyl-[acyl-carrier protein] reductase